MASKKRWTSEMDEQLIELIQQDNLSYFDAGKALGGLHPEAVRSRYRKLRKGSNKIMPETNEEKVEIEFDGPNTMIASQKAYPVKTLDELIRLCEINLDEWEIDKHIINQWQVFSNDAGLVPLHQVKAWLIRKNPIALETAIKPIFAKTPVIPPKEKLDRDTQRFLIIPDIHIGFQRDTYTGELIPTHDRLALDVAIQVIKNEAENFGFDAVVFLGDILDLAEASDRFVQSPEFNQTTQPSLHEAHYWIRAIVEAAQAPRNYVHEGNHEERMSRAINKYMPWAHKIKSPNAIFPAMSIPNLLDLENLNCTWVGNYPNDETWLTDDLRAIHGNLISGNPGATAPKYLGGGKSTVFGHTHRFEYAEETIFTSDGPRQYFSFSSGCLCKIGDNVPSVKKQMVWQQGFSILEVDSFYYPLSRVIQVPIQNGMALRNGVFEARTEQEIRETLDNTLPFRV